MRLFVPVLLAIAFAACGEEEEPARTAVAERSATPTATATPTPNPQRRGCSPAGGGLRFCRLNGVYGTLRTATGPLPVQRPRGAGGGGWVWAAAAPDGRTILLQWSGECEIPIAYLVPSSGGRPRKAIPGGVNSTALGWTSDGRAIVFVPAEPGCGSGASAGLFLVGAGGSRERIGPAARRPPIRASVRPRAADAIS